MTRQELIDICLTFPAAIEDYPFDEVTTVMKHSANKKMFALIGERDGKLYINLKCEPMKADFLRNAFEAVTPGYHMNKVHWNSVAIGGDVPEDELVTMISESYDLIKPKSKRK